MNSTQTASSSLHSPVIAGVPRVGRGGGFFLPMDQSLDYYRKLAETDPDVAVLVAMIDRLTDELTSALTAAIRP
jgi:hypothetical protein